LKQTRFLCFYLLLLIICTSSTTYATGIPNPSAVSAVLLNAASGQIIYAKNAHAIMAPASTTKIMTAMLVLEHLNLNKTVTISAKAATREGSSMYLRKNEKKTVRDLLYGLMLSSGNDAATALAEAVSGTESKFAALMTTKARLLGMKNTQFKNASGLPARGHYSTAYDLGILTRYALKNGNFSKIVGTKVKEVSGAGTKNRRLINHNKLLWRYRYTNGVKTGFTQMAGGCLVSSASKNGNSLISVVLKTSYIYDDTQKLFEYGFSKLQNSSNIASCNQEKSVNSYNNKSNG
jgi:D-alanyl-D-alanine carboxypeptidase (penicillin-binding protein 5/6)